MENLIITALGVDTETYSMFMSYYRDALLVGALLFSIITKEQLRSQRRKQYLREQRLERRRELKRRWLEMQR